MKKITQSFLAVSLSAAMILQNTAIISNAEEINSNEVEKTTYLNEEVSTGQVDPETIVNYSMGESSYAYSRTNELPDLHTKSLTNDNSIGLGTVSATTLNIRSGP